MDFVAINLFLFLYYIRPHEWIGALSTLRLAGLSLVMAIVGTVMRERGFHPKEILKTPHDWCMLAYFIWIILAAPSMPDALANVYNVFLYYVLTVQTLYQLPRINRFLVSWTVMILVVATLAIVSLYGLDPMNSADLTRGLMKNRLVLNTSIFNNPNALGHSIVPAVIMLYYLGIWKRPVFMKLATAGVILLPLYCVYLTFSKGAFLTAFVAIITAAVFGRPKPIQLLIIFLAATIGWTALHSLPRMGELDKAQSDRAIQGRVAAFHFGLQTMKSHWKGVGYGNWGSAFYAANRYSKDAHSSYVMIGAEMGRPGLCLFLAIIYCSFRTLMGVNSVTVEQERIRRLLFVLLICYTVSSWMVGFAFRATFFLMVAAIGAFHRLLLADPRQTNEAPPSETGQEPAFAWPGLQPAWAAAPFTPRFERSCSGPGLTPAYESPSSSGGGANDHETQEPRASLSWTKIGILDVVAILLLTFATERFWAYIMTRI